MRLRTEAITNPADPNPPLDLPTRADPRETPAEVLAEACAQERRGCLAEAIERYEAAVELAEGREDHAVTSAGLRHLAVVHHKSGDAHRARALCRESYRAARRIPDALLAAEALNTRGVVEMEAGALERSRRVFRRALHLGGRARAIRARVDQNLGILANIQGRLVEARQWYERSLDEYRNVRDEHGCAIAYHNLGMVSTDAGQYDEAERHLRASIVIARRTGDRFLEALCLVNQADVDFARQGYESARQHAEEALALFEQLGARGAKSDAYRVIGMVYRETGKPILAESRLRSAIAVAVSVGSVLGQAEASRELSVVYQGMGRNQEALRCLHDAYRLFRRLDAQVDLVYVGGKRAELETTYRAVVRAWGRSIESADSYTFGHCERVAQLAVGVAQLLGLDDHAETTVLLGAYLHDVGMVRVPHEVLQKDGALTDAERRLLETHPTWGVEMLANIEFPWDISRIVRWHHEHRDGSGYPDGLAGDAIPLAAQIVGIADCYDDLSSTRAPRRGRPRTGDALAEIRRCAAWWAPEVVAAFEQVVAGNRPSSSD
jgi:putative nucleotidyltransferase with HDIG domain